MGLKWDVSNGMSTSKIIPDLQIGCYHLPTSYFHPIWGLKIPPQEFYIKKSMFSVRKTEDICESAFVFVYFPWVIFWPI